MVGKNWTGIDGTALWENTLFLYDEPDVHFNDDWNKDFMKILYELSKNTHHQFLIATHWTLLVTDARQEQLMLIHQVPEKIQRCVQREFLLLQPIEILLPRKFFMQMPLEAMPGKRFSK